MNFVLRVKQERYIQQEFAEYTHLSELRLLPGTSFFLTGVKVTKQKGFGLFNVAGYWRRKSKGKVEDEGWYLLTNLETHFCRNFCFQKSHGYRSHVQRL